MGVKQVTGVYIEARMVKKRQLGLYREIGGQIGVKMGSNRWQMRGDIDQTNASRLSTCQIGVKFGYSYFPEMLEFCRE